MCWRIDKIEFDNNPKNFHKKAQEDIIVYKFGTFWCEDKCFHPYYHSNFTYIANSLNKELNLVTYKGYEYYSISEGYHSFINKQMAFDESSSSILFGKVFEKNNVGKFIIPKGTEYYKNEDGEIVSSNIIWTGEIL